jgi:hypothetical protein
MLHSQDTTRALAQGTTLVLTPSPRRCMAHSHLTLPHDSVITLWGYQTNSGAQITWSHDEKWVLDGRHHAAVSLFFPTETPFNYPRDRSLRDSKAVLPSARKSRSFEVLGFPTMADSHRGYAS